MNPQHDIEKRTLTIERLFEALRKLVWEAWTQPEHIAHWWGRGMAVDIKKHDFREGGEWEYSMTMPDGNAFITNGIYTRIVEFEVIETSANFLPMTEGVTLIITFIESGSNTELIFQVVHPTEEYCKQQEEMGFYNGWGSVFEVLESYLSTWAH